MSQFIRWWYTDRKKKESDDPLSSVTEAGLILRYRATWPVLGYSLDTY